MDIDVVLENQGLDADTMHEQEPSPFLLHLARASIMLSLEAELRAFVRACNCAQPAPVTRLGFGGWLRDRGWPLTLGRRRGGIS